MDFSAYESIITKRLLYFWIIGFIALILSIISIVYLIRNMRNQKLLFWILMVLSFSVVIGMTILVENITVDSIYDITNQAYRVQEGKFQICNDIETRSGSCSLILPDGTREIKLRRIMEEIETACSKLKIEVMGGHTEISDAVNRPIINVTGVGKVKKGKIVSTGGLKPG